MTLNFKASALADVLIFSFVEVRIRNRIFTPVLQTQTTTERPSPNRFNDSSNQRRPRFSVNLHGRVSSKISSLVDALKFWLVSKVELLCGRNLIEYDIM